MICPYILDTKYIFFTPETSTLVYYSHVTSFVVAFIILILLFLSNTKSSSTIYFKYLLSIFSIWVIFNLVLWTNNESSLIFFLWSFFGILTIFLSIFCYWLFKTFVLKEIISLKDKIIALIFLIPVIFFMPTKYNLNVFDIDICGIAGNADEGNLPFYFFSIAFVYFFVIFYKFFINFKKFILDKDKTSLFFSVGIIFFMISFFTTSFLASFLANIGIISDFGLEQYGLFGMTVFISIITFLIVKFKAFNIKLLGAQALVWALIILVGSQFLYLADMPVTSIVLTSITLALSAGIGLLVVRSVKKVDEQRELLDIANKNQESLLHFITHQIKGFMTKTRGIYAGILEGDYGEINGKVREIVQYGLESETKGVQTIQNILHASDLKKGIVEFNKKEFDLTGMVRTLVSDSRKMIIDKGLELEENISSKPILFRGDEMRIREVFKNLLDNSIHYTEHGKISVTLKELGDKIRYSIKDTGIGLSTKDKKDLFTEGGKGEKSLAHNVDSTGYGLYIAKKIVLEHKGTVWAESAGRDKGSEFIVELPINKI
jgi:signal transduction histidine kinase